jgi:hypothetical protein
VLEAYPSHYLCDTALFHLEAMLQNFGSDSFVPPLTVSEGYGLESALHNSYQAARPSGVLPVRREHALHLARVILDRLVPADATM